MQEYPTCTCSYIVSNYSDTSQSQAVIYDLEAMYDFETYWSDWFLTVLEKFIQTAIDGQIT